MDDGGHDTNPATALSMNTTTTPAPNSPNANSNPDQSQNQNYNPNPNDAEPTAPAARTRSGSAGSSASGHRRSVSGSLLSKLSFLRSAGTAAATPDQVGAVSAAAAISEQEDDDGDNDVPGASLRGGSKAMASALQQQQRRTRRRRGSLRKTALLGTRFESKKVNHRVASGGGGGAATNNNTNTNATSSTATTDNDNDNNSGDFLRGGGRQHVARNVQTSRPYSNSVSTGIGEESRAVAALDRENNPRWGYTNTSAQQKRPLRGASASVSSRHKPNFAWHSNMFGEETVTDDEDMVFRRINNDEESNNGDPVIAAPDLQQQQHKHLGTASSSSDSFYALQSNPSSYGTVHRPPKSSSLTTTTHHHHHPADIKPTTTTTTTTTAHQESIIWDYSETESWGWIILLVTWLVFVIGMGSCFGVWSWAWDVGETPYAPPELEDDPTLPIVGYYPALIILTAVMSWVWVVVAWVGMKYFKHANISGEDT